MAFSREVVCTENEFLVENILEIDSSQHILDAELGLASSVYKEEYGEKGDNDQADTSWFDIFKLFLDCGANPNSGIAHLQDLAKERDLHSPPELLSFFEARGGDLNASYDDWRPDVAMIEMKPLRYGPTRMI